MLRRMMEAMLNKDAMDDKVYGFFMQNSYAAYAFSYEIMIDSCQEQMYQTRIE